MRKFDSQADSKKMKVLSVLVAAYKAERWLSQSINSVMEQTLPKDWELEVLVGVDGCNPTLQEAKRLKNERLKIVALNDNYGAYITFNTLMDYANGDLICRFDADDVMLPGYLIEQIHCLQNEGDICSTWSIYTDEKLQPTSFVPAYKDPRNHPKNGLKRTPADGNFIMKREVWDALGGYQPWRCGADTEFRKRTNICGLKLVVVEQFLYYRRTHSDSLTCHPSTNFESKLRMQLANKISEYVVQYQNLSRPIKIEAVRGEVHERFF